MPIAATSPTQISATYPYWAFQISTEGFGCASVGQDVIPPITMTIALRKFRVRPDGIPELSPLETPSDYQVISIPDFYALAAQNQDVTAALTALIAAVESFASAGQLI